MSDLTDKQKYYEYDPSQGGSWWLKDEPTAEPWFQQELTLFAGVSDRGQPNLRLVWGATVLHDITERPQLKYKVVREIVTGFNYVKKDGEIGKCDSMNLATDAKIPWEFYPITKRLELGRLRWAIERHVPAHELRRLGRFQNRRAPDGEIVLRELPEEGVYDHFFWIQTAAHKYREPDREVLTAVEAMFHYNITTSEAQKALDAIEREKNQTLIGGAEAKQIWSELNT